MIYEVFYIYIKYYIMITKFKTRNDEKTTLEFSKENEYLRVIIEDSDIGINEVFLNEQDLFSLIGQLLRIQSEIRAEVNNG